MAGMKTDGSFYRTVITNHQIPFGAVFEGVQKIWITNAFFQSAYLARTAVLQVVLVHDCN